MNKMQCIGLGRVSLIAAACFAVAPIGLGQEPASSTFNTFGHVVEASADQAYLGVYPEESADGGVKLGDVVAGSPAEKAGLKAGDVIVSMNDRTVGNEAELRAAIASFGVNSKVKITFLRDGEKRRTSARLAKVPGEAGSDEGGAEIVEVEAPVELAPAGGGGGPVGGIGGGGSGYLGVQLEAFDGGAKVLEVLDNSPAEKAGLQAGDVILKIDDDDIESVEALVKAVQARHAGDTVRLMVERDGEQMRVKAKLGTRGGAAGSVGAAPLAPVPPTPAEPRRATRAPAPAAQADSTRREIDELRAQIQELRQRCEQQQRTLDAIRRAINGGPNPEPSPEPGSSPSAMAFPVPGHSSLMTGLMPTFTTLPAPATVPAPVVAPAGEGASECCAGATAVASAEACAAAEGACCAEGSVSMTTSSDEPGVFFVEAGEGGAHGQSIIVTTDEEPKVRARTLRLGGMGGGIRQIQIDEQPVKVKFAPAKVKSVKVAPAPSPMKVKAQKTHAQKTHTQKAQAKKSANKAMPKAMKVQSSPKTMQFKGLGGEDFEVRVEGLGAHSGGRSFRLLPSQGNNNSFQWQPRIAVPHGGGTKKSCAGSCAVHCMDSGGQGSLTVFGHDASSGGAKQLQCAGPCTIVIRGDQCEVRCEDGCQVSDVLQFAGEECEGEECCPESENEECCEEEEATAAFQLFGGETGHHALTFDVEAEDDEACCGTGKCCSCEHEDDDDDDDDEDDDEDDDDEDDDEDEDDYENN